MYLKETEAEDRELVDVLTIGIDQLLIFVRTSFLFLFSSVNIQQAGLFGAILTAFLVESRKELVEDPLQEILLVLRNASGIAIDQTPFKPSRVSQAVNGIWFFSLGLTLLSALAGVLSRGWLAKYIPANAGKRSNDACERYLRYLRATGWGLAPIVTAIPLLIQTALFLFSIGLVIFLFKDDLGISISLMVLTTLAVLVYIIFTILPWVFPACPFQTTISDLLPAVSKNRRYRESAPPENDATMRPTISTWGKTSHLWKEFRRKPKQIEIQGDILAWILTSSTNDTTIEEAVKALAGAESSTYLKRVLCESGASRILCQRFVKLFKVGVGLPMTNKQTMRAEVYLYAMLRIVEPVRPLSDEPATFEFISDSLLQLGQPLRRWDHFPEYLQPLACALRLEMLLVTGMDDPVDYREQTALNLEKMVESGLLPDIRWALVEAAFESLLGAQCEVKKSSIQILCKQWAIGKPSFFCSGTSAHRVSADSRNIFAEIRSLEGSTVSE